MTRFAEGTSVSAERSRAEIEQTLLRFGADQFAYGWETDRAMVQFRAHERLVRFTLPLPARDDPAITHTPSTRQRRTEGAIEEMYQRATRQRWRALLLIVKAKLEAVETGIVAFEDEFLAQTVLPDGSTAGEWMQPQLQAAYATGQMPHAMPALGSGR
jgi:hypothetical protein